MNTWILVVMLVGGRTIGSPFPTEKECRAAIVDVKKLLKKDKNVASIECVEGSIEEEKSSGKDESYI